MGRALVANECQGKCSWSPTQDEIDGKQVFACGACKSEWTSAQSWTPRNWDGEISPEVARARRLG